MFQQPPPHYMIYILNDYAAPGSLPHREHRLHKQHAHVNMVLAEEDINLGPRPASDVHKGWGEDIYTEKNQTGARPYAAEIERGRR